MIELNLKKNSRGFSLIELCVLLAMTAILTVIAIPMLSSSMRAMQLVSDTRNIATTMTYAKLNAVSQCTSCRLSFDMENNTWKLEKRNRSTGDYELEQAINKLSSGVANSGITFKSNSSSAPSGFPTASSTTITFSSRGIPVEGMSIVYLSNNSENYAVSSSLSGKVQVWRYRDNQWVRE